MAGLWNSKKKSDQEEASAWLESEENRVKKRIRNVEEQLEWEGFHKERRRYWRKDSGVRLKEIEEATDGSKGKA